jgi:hypothetical protein
VANYNMKPSVMDVYCTCARDDEGALEVYFAPDESGEEVAHYFINPECILHGEKAEKAPF